MGFPCYQNPEIKYTMKVQISCPTWLNQVFLCISKYLGSLHKKNNKRRTHPFLPRAKPKEPLCFPLLFSQSSNLPATKRLHTTASFNSLWLTWNSRDELNGWVSPIHHPFLQFHKSKQRKPREGAFFHGHDFETWNACNIRKEKINRNKKTNLPGPGCPHLSNINWAHKLPKCQFVLHFADRFCIVNHHDLGILHFCCGKVSFGNETYGLVQSQEAIEQAYGQEEGLGPARWGGVPVEIARWVLPKHKQQPVDIWRLKTGSLHKYECIVYRLLQGFKATPQNN